MKRIQIKSKSTARYWLGIVILTILILTLNPFEFSSENLEIMFGYGKRHAVGYVFYFAIIDFLLNILLFTPLGWLIFQVRKPGSEPLSKRSILSLLLLSGSLSFTVEFAQAFLDRSASVMDMLTNTGGSLLGYFAAFHFQGKFARGLHFRGVRRILAPIYTIFLIGIMLLPYRRNIFSNWERRYPLILGNEVTLDRPWNGDILLARIHDRPLDRNAVTALFMKGPGDPKPDETGVILTLTPGLMAEDTLLHGGVIVPMHEPAFSGGIQYRQMLRLRNGAHYISPAAGETVAEALQGSGSFSVELWLRTGDLSQTGPARIIGSSASTNLRNFTVAQEGNGLQFRVRTPLSGLNGSYINLHCKGCFTDKRFHHITAVFNRGAAAIFLDAERVNPSLQADWHFFPALVEIGRNFTARTAMVWLLLFPLAVLWAGVPRKSGVLAAVAAPVLFCIIIQLFYHFTCGQIFGWTFLMASLLTGATAAVGEKLLKDHQSPQS